MSATARGLAQGATALAAAGLAVVAVVVVGRTLPFPRVGSPAAASAWIEQVRAPVAAFTALRAVVGVVAAWAVVSWAVGVCARVVDNRGAVALADRLSAPGVRRLAAAAATVVALSTTTPAGGATPTPAPSMVDLGPVLVDLGPAEAPTGTALPSPAPEPAIAARTWVVAPGETLWRVAEATAIASGAVPTGDEVVAQLDRLIRLNADRLVVPDNPDLVLPGQEFLVP